jgi:hypothetical protein
LIDVAFVVTVLVLYDDVLDVFGGEYNGCASVLASFGDSIIGKFSFSGFVSFLLFELEGVSEPAHACISEPGNELARCD